MEPITLGDSASWRSRYPSQTAPTIDQYYPSCPRLYGNVASRRPPLGRVRKRERAEMKLRERLNPRLDCVTLCSRVSWLSVLVQTRQRLWRSGLAQAQPDLATVHANDRER